MRNLCRHFANINIQTRRGRLLKDDLGAALSGNLTSEQKARLKSHIKTLLEFSRATTVAAIDDYRGLKTEVRNLIAELNKIISTCSVSRPLAIAA